MKKLLFLIAVLFGILSIQSLAGCGAQVCTCPNGGYVIFGQDCPSSSRTTYYGGMAINPYTRKFGSAWNYQNGKEAEKQALKNCGSDSCVSTWASSSYMVIAISEDEKYWGYSASNTQSTAWSGAVAECQKSGKTCHVALVGYPDEKARYVYWGAVAYNPDTRQTGKTSNEFRKRAAENAALVSGGCTYNPNCYFYAFQTAYGALAKGESNQVYSGSSNKSLKDAEKQAEKNCKKESGDKQCKALVSSAKEVKK